LGTVTGSCQAERHVVLSVRRLTNRSRNAGSRQHAGPGTPSTFLTARRGSRAWAMSAVTSAIRDNQYPPGQQDTPQTTRALDDDRTFGADSLACPRTSLACGRIGTPPDPPSTAVLPLCLVTIFAPTHPKLRAASCGLNDMRTSHLATPDNLAVGLKHSQPQSAHISRLYKGRL